MGNPMAKELDMVALECSQIILEIEKLIRGIYNLNTRGFIVIFYEKPQLVIGYKVIDENKSRINLESDEFARIDSFGDISSAINSRLKVIFLEYAKLKDQFEFNNLSRFEKHQLLVLALNEFYLQSANIPSKLFGIR
jgi:hypothetical protein